MIPRPPRCHWRYSDAPMPADLADQVRRQRASIWHRLAWLLFLLGVATLLVCSLAEAPPASLPF